MSATALAVRSRGGGAPVLRVDRDDVRARACRVYLQAQRDDADSSGVHGGQRRGEHWILVAITVRVCIDVLVFGKTTSAELVRMAGRSTRSRPRR